MATCAITRLVRVRVNRRSIERGAAGNGYTRLTLTDIHTSQVRGFRCQIEAYVALSEALLAAGKPGAAREALIVARSYGEKKGGVVILSSVLRRIEDLDAARATREIV